MSFALRRIVDPDFEPVTLEDMKLYLRVDIDDDDSLISTLISVARERSEDMTSRGLCRQQWLFALDRFPSFCWREGSGNEFQEVDYPKHNSLFRNGVSTILLPRGPVLSVDSITYVDSSGATQTLDPTAYKVDLISEPARISPAYGASWPAARWETSSVQVKFTTGYEQEVTETVTTTSNALNTAPLSKGLKALRITSAKVAGVSVTNTLTAGSLHFQGFSVPTTVEVVYQAVSIPETFKHAIKLMVGAWYENREEVVQGGGNFNSMPTPMSAKSLLSTHELFVVGYPRS